MRSYSREVGAHHKTEIVYGVPRQEQLRSARAVVCTNLDRPVEAYCTLKACQGMGIPFVLYALHHPDPGIESYLSRGTRGFKGVIARTVGCNPQRYEMVLWLIRVVVTAARYRRLLPVADVRKAQRKIVESADAIAVCSAGEAEQIATDIGRIRKPYVVPHAADFPPPVDVEVQRNLIVVPGRIEARKNQLAALAIARRLPELSFLFVGGMSPSERGYFSEFSDALAKVPNARHVSELSKEKFYPTLASAEVVLNASFFEVTSLIDLYCIQNSIPLVTTVHTYARASGAFRQFNPTDIDRGVAALLECLEDARIHDRSVQPSAESAAVTLTDVIESVI